MTPDELPQIVREVVGGEAISLATAARSFPSARREGQCDRTTVWRWATTGHRLASGVTVVLETARVGGRLFTSRAAITRFVARLTPSRPSPGAPSVATAASAASRRRAATSRLAAAGC
jgi:hypothetical protein